MKELTIEQKAKAYDEALERAKVALNDGTISNNTIAYLQDIFPELAESEDEKIRKYLISFIKLESGVNLSPDDVGKILAWLEKQGELTQSVTKTSDKGWSDEDEENLQHCCGAIGAADYYTVEDKQEMEDWLKSLKERLSKR